MEFSQQLNRILCDQESTDDKPLCLSVQQWNDSVEGFFGNPRFDTTGGDTASETVQETASLLQRCILSTVINSCSCFSKEDQVSVDCVASIDSEEVADAAAKKAADIAKRHFESIEDQNQLRLISELLRSSKNILRLHSQVLASQSDLQQPLNWLTGNGMLELYMVILQMKQPDPARHASLSLFYSTYNPMNDPDNQKRQEYMIDKLDFLTVLMDLLLKARPTNFVLTIARHVHNLVASIPVSTQQMDVILMQLSANRTKEHNAPWSQWNWDNLSSFLVCITAWCLQSEPPFPGNAADRRAELVLECLRILFILRPGTTIMEASDKDENSFKRLVCNLLRLDNNNGRAYACKLATVSLLMDAPPGFGACLLSRDCIGPLLDILDLQVTSVVDNCIYGNQAATELTPILVALIKFSAANETVLHAVKDRIFPPEMQDAFQKKATVERKKATNDSGGGVGAKNMVPLDAPKGTLRWKMTRLMTWTESHTKRLTSELLWTLCGGDAQEFVLRTGFGNAMPLLAQKGLVQMPAEMSR